MSAADLFLELAAIPSPPGEERAVADVVLRYLRDLGLTPDEDDCGPSIGSSMGNVYARLEPTAAGTPVEGAPMFEISNLQLTGSGEIGMMQLNLLGHGPKRAA